MRTAPALLLSLVTLLVGCGSSPPVRFYALDSMSGTYETGSAETIIGVGPLSFPDYLKRPQIVTRTSSTALNVAEFDRWAEPLDAAFQRTLTANVDALLSDVLVIEFPFGGGRVAPDYRVMAQVARYDVGADGNATLDVRWGIGTGDDEDLVAPRRDQYRAAAGGSDYDSIVSALREVLEAFSRDVASSFQAATDR